MFWAVTCVCFALKPPIVSYIYPKGEGGPLNLIKTGMCKPGEIGPVWKTET